MPDSDQLYLLHLYQRSVFCFERAMALMSHKVCKVEIPYRLNEGRMINLPGWFHQPNSSQRLNERKTPVLICIGGADSTQEELYFMSVADGLELGYAILTFDGPGQGLVLRRERVHMRPEGEAILGSVLDFIESYAREHPEAGLDLEALTVTGQSLGGFHALRGAADTRIRACVAVDPFYDMWDLAMARMPSWMVAPWDSGWIGDWLIDWAARTHGRQDIATRYQFALAQCMFGTPTPGSTLRAMKQYTFKLGAGNGEKGQDYLQRIKCPVLITAAAADAVSFLPEVSADAIMKGLVSIEKGQKKLWVANTYAEGGAQAKSGAWQLLQHRVFRFLDEMLGIKRTPSRSVDALSDKQQAW